MTVVTPPRAAARVPVFQSSLETVPQKGSSRWTCTSRTPGRTYLPAASTTVAPLASASETAANRGDLLATDGDVGLLLSRGTDHGAVGDDEIVSHIRTFT